MRPLAALALVLVSACSSTSEPQAPPGGGGPGAPSAASPGSRDPDAVPVSIDALVDRLGKTGGLWINGASPTLAAKADAKADAVLREMFDRTSLDEGRVTTFEIVEARDVTIKPETRPIHAVLVRTNLGTAVVLLRHEGASGWWTRAYRTVPR